MLIVRKQNGDKVPIKADGIKTIYSGRGVITLRRPQLLRPLQLELELLHLHLHRHHEVR